MAKRNSNRATRNEYDIRTLQTIKSELNRLDSDFGTQLKQILTKEENITLSKALASAWLTLDAKVNLLKGK